MGEQMPERINVYSNGSWCEYDPRNNHSPYVRASSYDKLADALRDATRERAELRKKLKEWILWAEGTSR